LYDQNTIFDKQKFFQSLDGRFPQPANNTIRLPGIEAFQETS
jgi:hypothetical protein